jgi:hypothetical protein
MILGKQGAEAAAAGGGGREEEGAGGRAAGARACVGGGGEKDEAGGGRQLAQPGLIAHRDGLKMFPYQLEGLSWMMHQVFPNVEGFLLGLGFRV